MLELLILGHDNITRFLCAVFAMKFVECEIWLLFVMLDPVVPGYMVIAMASRIDVSYYILNYVRCCTIDFGCFPSYHIHFLVADTAFDWIVITSPEAGLVFLDAWK